MGRKVSDEFPASAIASISVPYSSQMPALAGAGVHDEKAEREFAEKVKSGVREFRTRWISRRSIP
jgi:hypothetical protein